MNKLKNAFYDTKLVSAATLNNKFFLPNNIKPKLAGIHLTEKCNSRCITCTCWRESYPDEISKEKAIELLLELKELGVSMVRFSGGEPLVRQDFFEILSQIPPNSFKRIVLATNGLLTGKYKDEINNSIITNLSVSFDAMGENNDQIRGIPGYFEKVMTNLEGINKPIKIVSNFTNMLSDDIDKMIELCKQRGYGFDVNLLDSSPYFFDNEEVVKSINSLKPTQEQVEKVITSMKKHNLLNYNIEKNIREFTKNNKFCFKHCMLGYFGIYIASNGDVRTGCYTYKPIGNILNSSVSDLLQSEAYKKSVLNMYNLKCPLCTCGYGISAVYSNPLASLEYIKRRLK